MTTRLQRMVRCAAPPLHPERQAAAVAAMAERSYLPAPRGEIKEIVAGDYSALAQLRDPDGNLITLATPPARPFPLA